MYWPRDMDKQDGFRRTAQKDWRIKDVNPSRMMREVNRPNGSQSKEKGRYSMRERIERPKPMIRREEQEKRGTWELRHRKQSNHWKQESNQQRIVRSNWSPTQNRKGGQNFEEITNQLKRLTKLLEGMVLGGRNL